jgi:hypothetical protein
MNNNIRTVEDDLICSKVVLKNLELLSTPGSSFSDSDNQSIEQTSESDLQKVVRLGSITKDLGVV